MHAVGMPTTDPARWDAVLSTQQQAVSEARERLAYTIAGRAAAVDAARKDGVTIYHIAQLLGVTQAAVRKILGL